MNFIESSLMLLGALFLLYCAVAYMVALITVNEILHDESLKVTRIMGLTFFIIFAPVTLPHALYKMRKEHEPK